MKIDRSLLPVLINEFSQTNKIVILYGARQTGKTTLSNDLLTNIKGKILKINADELRYVDILSSRDLRKMKLLIGGYDVLFIDEAQRIKDIGINLKIIHDNLPQLKLLVTGSSSFDLANKVKEPLTGRTSTYNENFATSYFWRTYTGAELDYIEEHNGKLFAYEIKYKKAKMKAPRAWKENYSSNYKCITYNNFWDFVI